MNQRLSIIVPVLNSITTLCWTLLFCFAFLDDQSKLNWKMVLYGVCAVLSLAAAISNWIRYIKDKEGKE